MLNNKLLSSSSIYIILIAMVLSVSSCSKDGGINVFGVQDDIALGQQLAQQIEADPINYPILDPILYSEAYGYLENIVNTVLSSDEILYREEFAWQFRIIQDDSVLNAFAAPGGYIYVYTGLIKYLDDEAQLAGVVGHEIAHADKRHSTERLTQQYGIELLLTLLLGDNAQGALVEIANGLTSLAFSRANETESDEFSVIYLNPTEYDARGAAGFFIKLEEANQGNNPPTFLSTHPAPDNRIEKINTKWEELGAIEGELFIERYQDFKNSLP